MSDTLRFERKTIPDLTSENPILDDGEAQFGISDYTSTLKIGDGKTNYNDLPLTVIKNSGVTCSNNGPNIYPDVRTEFDVPRFKYKSDIVDPRTIGSYLLRLSDIHEEYTFKCIEVCGNFSDSDLKGSSTTIHSTQLDETWTLKLIVPIDMYSYNKISYCKISNIELVEPYITLDDNTVNSTFKICKYNTIDRDSTIDYQNYISEIHPSTAFTGHTIHMNDPIIYEDCYTYLMELCYTSDSEFDITVNGWKVDTNNQRLYQLMTISDDYIEKLNVQIPIKYECYKHVYSLPNIINFGDSCCKIVDKFMHNYYLRYFDGDKYVNICPYVKHKSALYVYGDIVYFPIMYQFDDCCTALGRISNDRFINCTVVNFKDNPDLQSIAISSGSSDICQIINFNLDGSCGYLENTDKVFTNITHIVEDIPSILFKKDVDFTIPIFDNIEDIDKSEPIYVGVYSDVNIPLEYIHYGMDGSIHIKSTASFYQTVKIVLFTSLGEPFHIYNTYLVVTEY